VHCAHSWKVTATTHKNVDPKTCEVKQFLGNPQLFFVQDPASNSWIEEKTHPQPKRVIDECVESCETEQGLRKSTTYFQCDVRPWASGTYLDDISCARKC
jgi:hypothetical protein